MKFQRLILEACLPSIISTPLLQTVLRMNSVVSSNRSQRWNEGNESMVSSFILLAFSEFPYLQVPLFLGFLIMYTVTVLENLGMIFVIRINLKLHTPMYFFLSHLSFVDFCYTSVIAPKLLGLLLVEDKTISFEGCMAQYFLGCTFVITEMFMLAVMAYDRFEAVCNPLLYTVAMSRQLCSLLVVVTYIWAVIFSSTLTYVLLQLSYCGPNVINHFCCEYSALLSVSCSDTSFSQMACLVISMFNEACCLLIIITSYVFIVVTVIKIPTKGALRKAFSTCASHLTAIGVCHGIVLLLYCVLKSKSSLFLVKVATVFHSMVIPMLNPLIYSLRNKDVKETVRKLVYLKCAFHSL